MHGGLTVAQIWASPHGFGSVGFHIRHIAGSVDRLMTYLQKRELTETQMEELRDEARPLGCTAGGGGGGARDRASGFGRAAGGGAARVR